MPDNKKRDSRIQSNWNPIWFPFAEFNGGSTQILFDAAPSPRGSYGQIIVYQHDPDAVYFVADNTDVFLGQTTPILERCLKELADLL